jgi:hypothetical protein
MSVGEIAAGLVRWAVVFLRLAGYVLWIPAAGAIIMAVILLLVSSRLPVRSRLAARFPRCGCSQVRARSGPVHVQGTTVPGRIGPLMGSLTGASCVWYRNRVLRRHWVTRVRYTNDEWAEIDELVEEQIWSWDSGPFTITDDTGSVLVSPALLDGTLNAFGYPVQPTLDEIRDEGAEAWHYYGGWLGVLLGQGRLPPGLLDRFAGPAARTAGYRVQEQILPPALTFHVFALPADVGYGPMLATPFQDVQAISAQPLPVSLAHGGRRARVWAAWIGAGGVALFLASGLLLVPGGH